LQASWEALSTIEVNRQSTTHATTRTLLPIHVGYSGNQ
jgi:hypothetical protein